MSRPIVTLDGEPATLGQLLENYKADREAHLRGEPHGYHNHFLSAFFLVVFADAELEPGLRDAVFAYVDAMEARV